jgi:hypothetical protein
MAGRETGRFPSAIPMSPCPDLAITAQAPKLSIALMPTSKIKSKILDLLQSAVDESRSARIFKKNIAFSRKGSIIVANSLDLGL